MDRSGIFLPSKYVHIPIALAKSNGSCSFRAKYEQVRNSGRVLANGGFGNTKEIGNEMNSFSNVRHANFAYHRPIPPPRIFYYLYFFRGGVSGSCGGRTTTTPFRPQLAWVSFARYSLCGPSWSVLFSHSCGPWLSWILWSAVGAGLKCISPRLTSRMV